jgi:hypothetical protein
MDQGLGRKGLSMPDTISGAYASPYALTLTSPDAMPISNTTIIKNCVFLNISYLVVMYFTLRAKDEVGTNARVCDKSLAHEEENI